MYHRYNWVPTIIGDITPGPNCLRSGIGTHGSKGEATCKSDLDKLKRGPAAKV
jgi:hypothetical protein